VGPDGAGKTTTLRMLAGVLAPSGGDALVEGVSMARDPEAAKPWVAYMSQRFGLYADLTVAENLAFYADLYGVPRSERPERIARLHRFSGLGPFEHRLAGQLSGGMKQKLGLSCALIHQPRVLLLDEPTFGVDPVSRRDLWLIVHEMVGQGITAVVSTAYLDEAERFDRVALLHRGRLAALDRPAALRAGLAGRLLAVRVADPRGARKALAGEKPDLPTAIFGDRLHLTLPEGVPAAEAAAEVGEALSRAGHPPRSVAPVEPTLEDAFMAHVARAESG
jgi:ABC-2 type transport system ATP-binding protein